MSKIRVAYVSEPGTAGVKTHVIDLLRNLDVAAFDVSFFYSRRRSDHIYEEEIAALRARQVRCHEIPMDARFRPFDDLRALVQLLRGLRREAPHILHLHSSKAGGLGRLASLLLFPRPKVLYTPNAMACYRSRKYLWLERLLGPLTTVPIAVSASEQRDWVAWRIPRASVAAVIPSGVAASIAHSRDFQGDANSRRLHVGACGRICYQKNARLFFEVALDLLRHDDRLRFSWIGDFGGDDEARSVRALLGKAGFPPQIQITGWTENPAARLAELDVFCMFSRYESFGYVTAEAMRLGLPIVATPATGTIDLVRHEQSGLIVPPNAALLSAAILRLCDDRGLRESYGAAAMRIIDASFGIPQMVRATESLYRRIVTGDQPAT